MSGTGNDSDSAIGPGTSPDARPQLHGWKDIATYFGRSVRTVQRWERDFGLPIRRYGMGRAELVHAYLDDLERWKASAEAQAARHAGITDDDAPAAPAPPGTSGPPAPSAPPGPSATPAPLPPRSRLPVALTLLTALLAIVAIVAWVAIGGRGRPGGTTSGPTSGATSSPANSSPSQPGALDIEPGGWNFQGNTLVVKNADGRLLWTHEFPFRLADMVAPLALSDPNEAVRIDDVNGDGHQDVLAISSPADGRGEKYRFHAFSHTGRLLWDYARGGSVVFGDTTYTSPFLARHFHLTPREPRGSNIWLVSNHRPWFPSVLSQVEFDGTITSDFWSAGYVTMVWEGVVAGRRVVLVGARNNESEGASLAMLDAAHPAGSAPAEEARYQCRSCPPGAPLRFVKFPKPKRLQPLRGTGPVIRISVDGGSRIIVWVSQGYDTEVRPSPEVIYTLDADLRPLSVNLNDGFDASVRALAGRKFIPEPPATPAINEVQTVRWWNGTAFVSLTAPTSSAPTSSAPPSSAPAPAGAQPASLAASIDTLIAFGADGRQVWQRRLDAPITEYNPQQPAAFRQAWEIQDIDGDGSREVIFARASHADPRVYCFNRDGTIRFARSIDTPVRFGEYACPPVMLTHVFRDARPDFPGTFLVAGHHPMYFPAVLRRLGAQGRTAGEYWSNGHITYVTSVRIGGRWATLVGAAYNETGGASLAVFFGNIGGSAPASRAQYACGGCPAGTPDIFMVFPRSPLLGQLGVNASVGTVSVVGPDRLSVGVVNSGLLDAPQLCCGWSYYTLDRDFRVVGTELGGSYASLQRAFEADHRATAASRFRDPADFYPVRRWNGSGWDVVSGPQRPGPRQP